MAAASRALALRTGGRGLRYASAVVAGCGTHRRWSRAAVRIGGGRGSQQKLTG